MFPFEDYDLYDFRRISVRDIPSTEFQNYIFLR